MANNETHNLTFHEVLLQGRQTSYRIANSRGSGHSPPCNV